MILNHVPGKLLSSSLMKPRNMEQHELREKNCLDCQLRWFTVTHIQTSNHPTDRPELLCCTTRYEIYSINQQSEMIGKFWGFHGDFTINTTLENSNVIGWSALDDGWKCHINEDCRPRQEKTSQYDEVWNVLEYSTIWNNWKRWGLHCNRQ